MVKHILVIGASRGIGRGFVDGALAKYPEATVFATVRDTSKAVKTDRVVNVALELADEASIKAAAAEVGKHTQTLDLIWIRSGCRLSNR